MQNAYQTPTYIVLITLHHITTYGTLLLTTQSIFPHPCIAIIHYSQALANDHDNYNGHAVRFTRGLTKAAHCISILA